MCMAYRAIRLSSLDKGRKKYDKTFGATVKHHYTYLSYSWPLSSEGGLIVMEAMHMTW